MIVNGKTLSMTRGDTESITVTVTGYTLGDGDKIEFTVRKRPTSVTKDLHKVVTEFAENKAIFIISSADTSAMVFGNYVYDIQLTTADGAVITIIKPSGFVILPEVSY